LEVLRAESDKTSEYGAMAENIVLLLQERTAEMIRDFCLYDGTLLRVRENIEAFYSICEVSILFLKCCSRI